MDLQTLGTLNLFHGGKFQNIDDFLQIIHVTRNLIRNMNLQQKIGGAKVVFHSPLYITENLLRLDFVKNKIVFFSWDRADILGNYLIRYPHLVCEILLSSNEK